MRSSSSVCTLLVGCLLVVPAGLAPTVAADVASPDTLAFGHQVEATDPRVVRLMGPTPFAALCFTDDDLDGTFASGEALYASQATCGGTVVGNDLRLVPAAGQLAGSQVRASHSDFGNPVSALGAAVVDYYDADGDGVFSLDDLPYIDVDASATASVGDVRLSQVGAHPAGNVVAAADSDLNNALSGAPPAGFAVIAWVFFDADGDGVWTAGDVAYLDADGSGHPTVPDVRLGPTLGHAFGSAVLLGHDDAVQDVEGGAPFAAVCFVDDDGAGAYEAGEAVYATGDACGGNVGGNDLRLLPVAGHEAGTKVRASHADFGNPTQALPSSGVRFYDADGDGAFGGGDNAYLDPDGDEAASPGDVRITAAVALAAGTVVAPGDADEGHVFSGAPGLEVAAWRFADGDGDGAWTSADTAFIDVDQDLLTSVADVRVGPHLGFAYGTVVEADDADEVAALEGPVFVATCFVDDDGSGTYVGGEPLYALTSGCGSDLGANALRLVAAGGHAAGTQVRASHSDFGHPTTAPCCASTAFYDADGDGVYGAGDPVYLDLDGSGTVTAGDHRIAPPEGFDAAGSVGGFDDDVGRALVQATFDVSQWRFRDADGDGAWGPGDTAFIDADLNGFLTVLDVALGPAAATEPDLEPPSDLQAQLQQLIAQNTALGEQLNASLAENAQLAAQVNQLTSQLLALQQQLNTTLAQNAQLNAQLSTLQSQVSSLLAELERLRAEAEHRAPNLPPSAAIAPAETECVGGQGTVFLDGSGSQDPEGSPLQYAWQVFGGHVWRSHGPFAVANVTFGEHAAALGVSDGQLLGMAVQAVRVVDTQPPLAEVAGIRGEQGRAGWFTSPVEVDLRASDACGVAAMHHQLELLGQGPGPRRLGDHLAVLRDGSYVLHYDATDLGGLLGSGEPLRLQVDTLPPSTELDLAGAHGEDGWWRSNVTLVARASDATSGVESIALAVDGVHEGAADRSGATVAASVTGPGEHVVAFGAVDVAGNAEAPRRAVVRIDAEPPVTEARPQGEAGDRGWWRSSLVAVDLAARDAVSGVGAVFASVDGGPFKRADRVVVAGDGQHIVRYFAVDRAGNAEVPRSLEVRIDATAPTMMMLAPSAATLHLAGQADVPLPLDLTVAVGTVNATGQGHDATSGLHRYELWVDGAFRAAAPAHANASQGMFAWAAGDEAAGEHVVEVRAVDQAGNAAAVAREVLTVPTSPQGALASADCAAVLAAHVCASLPAAPGSVGQACAVALAPALCEAAAVACEELLAARVCALATAGAAPTPAVGVPAVTLARPALATP